MKIKRGVKLNGMTTQILLAIVIAKSIIEKYQKLPMVITSVIDGIHRRASKHKIGNGVDIRTRDMGPNKAVIRKQALAATKELKAALGAEFDVVLEKDHIHIEWDPK